MSEFRLDADTGLPEIPETHWWEVRKFSYTHQHPYGYGSTEVEDGYEVCLLTKVTVPARLTPGRYWWEPAKHTPSYVKDKVVLRKQITDPELYRDYANSSSSFSYRRVGKVFIEPADVLKVARDIIDQVFREADRVAREEFSESLVGVYPPNALISEGAL